jgi:hypothetical protein
MQRRLFGRQPLEHPGQRCAFEPVVAAVSACSIAFAWMVAGIRQKDISCIEGLKARELN